MKRLFPVLIAVGAVVASPACAARRSGEAAAAFDHADADRNGVITRAEFAASRMGRFERMDRNHDGAVSRSDFKRLTRLRRDAGERLDAFIAQVDADRDGKATRAEMAAAPMPLFDRADVNRDGGVDKAELAAVRAALKEAR